MTQMQDLLVKLEQELKEKESYVNSNIINRCSIIHLENEENIISDNFPPYLQMKMEMNIYKDKLEEIDKIKYMIKTLSDYLNQNE